MFFFSVLDQLPEGPIFIAMCFLVRIVDAIGFGAAITASSSILAKAFPNNVATVMVYNLDVFLFPFLHGQKTCSISSYMCFPHSLVCVTTPTPFMVISSSKSKCKNKKRSIAWCGDTDLYLSTWVAGTSKVSGQHEWPWESLSENQSKQRHLWQLYPRKRGLKKKTVETWVAPWVPALRRWGQEDLCES